MPSLKRIAPRDDVRSMVIKLEAPDGSKEEVALRYYRNRITLAPLDVKLPKDVDVDSLSDEEYDALKNASVLCHYLASWDLTGALDDTRDLEIVAEGEVIPLDPRIMQHVPSVVTAEFIRQMTEHVFPNASRSRNERRRSR